MTLKRTAANDRRGGKPDLANKPPSTAFGTTFRATWSVFALNRQEVTNTPLASSDDSSVIQMMEQDMAKLPPYVFRRPNGSYR